MQFSARWRARTLSLADADLVLLGGKCTSAALRQPRYGCRVIRPAETDGAPSQRAAEDIRRSIVSGELRPGDRVPSTREITKRWGVAMATATKILARLREEGLVSMRPGVGTVVAAQAGQGVASTPRRQPARGIDQDLTVDQVVQAAITIADTEGLPVLSMRRVASALDIATMTLYRYVPSKYDLVVRMADAVFAKWPPPDPAPAGWRACFELMARRHWAMYQRHPWVAQVISFTRPEPTPHALPNTEWTLSALDGLGLDNTTMLYLVVTLFSYVRGTAVNLESEVEAERDTGLTDEEWMAEQEERMAAIALSGEFPTLARVVEKDIDFNLERFFEFGLERLLDGMAVLIRP
jgi:DNA-binding transcriptional regulator YhcF (GntR family)